MTQGSKQSPKSSQQIHRQQVSSKGGMGRTAPTQTAMIDSFSMQQHNNFVNVPHQLATQMNRMGGTNNNGFSTALDEQDF